jgi:hypothetical protein
MRHRRKTPDSDVGIRLQGLKSIQFRHDHCTLCSWWILHILQSVRMLLGQLTIANRLLPAELCKSQSQDKSSALAPNPTFARSNISKLAKTPRRSPETRGGGMIEAWKCIQGMITTSQE